MNLVGSHEFRDYVERLCDTHHVTGLAIAVVHNRETTSVGFGKASLDPLQNVTGDTIFGIGSLCKSLTAAAVALLVNDNERYPHVQFEAAMSSLLPHAFVLPGDSQSKVTVGDILSHQSGMPAHEYSIFGHHAPEPDTAESIVKNLRNLPAGVAPRSEAIYCNQMYTAASFLVEQTVGIPFSDYVDEQIFRPLDMNATFLQPNEAHARGHGSRLASGYVRSPSSGQHQRIYLAPSPESQGSGNAVSSVNDYIKWIRAMVNQDGPITPKIFAQLTERRIEEYPAADENDRPGAFYAFGWKVSNYGGHVLVSHEGSEHGYTACSFFLPEIKFGAVIFCNASQADWMLSTLTYVLIDHALHGPQYESLAEMLSSLAIGPDQNDKPETAMKELECELRRELCPDNQVQEAQTLPLSAYTGTYWSTGYKYINIQDKKGTLFIDARDRSAAFTATFAHVCAQTKYLVFIQESADEKSYPVKAEFTLGEGRATKLGIQLEVMIEDYIWFQRQAE